ncbi:MAG: sulfite exporter TauE/SafE family protein [Isosphaeraceae bacterium]|nr:sulfite exporter TauE/SafE family protein [Isosphaeraceae bacterium]
MSDLSLAIAAGLLGSSHCFGMCGGFVVSIGFGSRTKSQNLIRQLIYALGRVFTYGFLGLLAGRAGSRLADYSREFVAVQAWLALTAGVILAVQGAATLGLALPRLPGRRSGRSVACLAASFARPLLNSGRWDSIFSAGVLNGLMPCGLVYGYLALAGSTGDLLRGSMLMLAFGIGTIPAMILTGLGASLISTTTRRRVFQAAGVCVLVTGIVAIGRGVGALSRGEADPDCGHPVSSRTAEPNDVTASAGRSSPSR